MKKIFVAIVVCMMCNVGLCYPELPNQCSKGEYNWFNSSCGSGYHCGTCPNNTYQDTDLFTGRECTKCPDGFYNFGNSPTEHDDISDCTKQCAPGTYIPDGASVCVLCPRDSYCPGGIFNPTNIDSGITQCKDGLYSPPGSDSADDCGRILHIGEYVLYLRTAKLTSPALHVKIGDVIYYGDMFPA